METLTESDLKTINPGQEINDRVINHFLQLLTKRNLKKSIMLKSIMFFPTFFLSVGIATQRGMKA